jgi:hypothetical protein
VLEHVSRADTPHQGELNAGIPSDITLLESPGSDNSDAANAPGDINSDIVRGRGSNCHTIIQKWKASDKGVSVCFGQQFINRAHEKRKNRVTSRGSGINGDGGGDGDRKLSGTSLGGVMIAQEATVMMSKNERAWVATRRDWRIW